MKNALLRNAVIATAAAVGLVYGGTLLADTPANGQVRQVGATAVVYQGPQVRVAVSYRFPKLNPGGTWLMLDTTMAANAGPVELPRSAISLRTPDGEVVPLASPNQYAEAYPQLAWDLVKDDATREPLELAVARPVRPLRYFPRRSGGPGVGAEWLDYFHARYGRLFFAVPDGIQPGRYALVMRVGEGNVVIPFTL